jgi:hypothetical protein
MGRKVGRCAILGVKFTKKIEMEAEMLGYKSVNFCWPLVYINFFEKMMKKKREKKRKKTKVFWNYWLFSQARQGTLELCKPLWGSVKHLWRKGLGKLATISPGAVFWASVNIWDNLTTAQSLNLNACILLFCSTSRLYFLQELEKIECKKEEKKSET